MKVADKTMRVVAFGFETFGTDLGNRLSLGSGPGYHMVHSEFDGYEALEGADAIIFEAGCFDEFRGSFRNAGEQKAYKEGRAREIYACLCQGATVCMLVGSLPQTPSDLLPDVGLQRDSPDYRLLRDIGIVVQELELPVTKLKAKRSEFDSFLREYGTATKSFEKSDGTFEFDICVAEDVPDLVTGFATRVKKGLLVCLPCLPRERFEPYIRDMLESLAPGLVTFSDRVLQEPPAWLAEVHLAPELPILEERENAGKKLVACDEQLAPYKPFKRILYLADDELAHAVPPVLEAIGFDEAHGFVIEDTSASEMEDFRINRDGELVVIGDAKSSTGNVKAIHIAKVDEHRTASGLNADFPGLCIINTFLGATSLEDKNTRVERRQCRIARETNVTVMRTLDLFWLLDEMLALDPRLRDVQRFLAFLCKGGGWLEWTKDGATLHGS